MSTANFDLTRFAQNSLPSEETLQGKRFAVVYAEWNQEITFGLAEGARRGFTEHGVCEDLLDFYVVPGTFELTFAASRLMKTGKYSGIVVIGCVIRGETPHFDYICQGVANGISALNAEGACPVVFSVLTTENMAQAEDRCWGKLGNKGYEGALCALKMLETFGNIK
ncbi:MAG: 6,7-dimethyl-8-ribityllumazine synthase [Paludibacteraceae bacterium]|nr:6,7-dimethyl-8-ribityllumazine synthase [Candidatus Colousia faecequi]MCQ2337989.1 6,7-dimethyl-8-ribityllumazine synthase [Paludibacteraceae bacterium]